MIIGVILIGAGRTKNLPYLKHMQKNGWHTYYVYILTNFHKTVLYTGMTNNLSRRLFEHHNDILNKKGTFVSRYKCRHLLYYEKYIWVKEAIAREKEIKGWLRVKKLELIQSQNPDMKFLEDMFPFEDSSLRSE